MKNILFNLLSNALKYTNEDGLTQCNISTEKNTLKIKISDNGIGIPESDQERLFDRFFRASNVEAIQGTGLGLNIVKQYVSLLDGNLSFESKEGVGTTFEISIPI